MKFTASRSGVFIPMMNVLKSTKAAIDIASIMVGIIVIGIIAGVIAATVFAVIPFAQDNAAKARLNSVSTAENAFQGFMTDEGTGLNRFGNKNELETYQPEVGSKGLLDKSPDRELRVAAAIDLNGKPCWVGASRSETGRVFYKTSKVSKIYENPNSTELTQISILCPANIPPFDEEVPPNDDDNPPAPGDGSSIVIPAGAAKLDLNVQSERNGYFGISGFGNFTDAQTASFGGGDRWVPEEGTSVKLSYWNDSTKQLVQFYDGLQNKAYDNSIDNGRYSNSVVDYEPSTKMIYGSFQSEENGIDSTGLDKIVAAGGSMNFVDASTGASVTVVWYPKQSNGFTGEPSYENLWEEKAENYYTNMIATNSDGSKVIASAPYLTGGNGVSEYSVSVDGGDTFYPIVGPGEPGYEYEDQAYMNSNGLQIVGDTAYVSTTDGRFWKNSNYADPAQRWTRLEFGDPTGKSLTFNVSADQQKIFISEPNGEKFVSLDGGLSWGNQTQDLDYGQQIGYWSPDGKLYVVQTYGKAYVSSNNGQTFTEITDFGADRTHVSIDSDADGSTVIISTQTALYRSNDHGVNWTTLTVPSRSNGKAMISNDGTKILLGDRSYVYISTDQGESWVAQSTARATFWGQLAIADDFSRLYAIASNTRSSYELWRHIEGQVECSYNCYTPSNGGAQDN